MTKKLPVYENALGGRLSKGAACSDAGVADDPWPSTEWKERLSEIDAGLENQRADIMAVLHKARRHEFDETAVWQHMRLLGGVYVGQMEYGKSTSAAGGKSLDQIANAAQVLANRLKECGVNLSDVLHSSITGSPLRDDELAIWMVTPPAASAARELEEFAERVRKIGTAMRCRRRRGRKDELPDAIILHLARIYEQATGRRPGSRGRFQRLVNTFLEGAGRPMSIDHVVKRIRVALRQG